MLLRSPRWFLPNWPVAYPCSLSSPAIVTILSLMPIGEAGIPTFERPVRSTLCPVMNDERPAVQLCSP